MAKLIENMPRDNRTRRHHVAAAVDDMMGALLYYDRKEDSDLPGRAIETALLAGEVTIDEIVEVVKERLEAGMRGLKLDTPRGCWGKQEACQCACDACAATLDRRHCGWSR